MVIAMFSFTHYGHAGSLTISDPKLVEKIQKLINLGLRIELYSILILLLLDEQTQCQDNENRSLIQLTEKYKVNKASVRLNNGETLKIV
ncbi:hypothetical protein FIV04_16370 (plasmid) [Vibrio sp. THAF190c]|nr:hypothetical protein FIV04_16370 [Vibrio sp. THAF190c]